MVRAASSALINGPLLTPNAALQASRAVRGLVSFYGAGDIIGTTAFVQVTRALAA